MVYNDPYRTEKLKIFLVLYKDGRTDEISSLFTDELLTESAEKFRRACHKMRPYSSKYIFYI